jgi:uncharacterized lipoprotein YddW (UPF0748 family)
MSRLSIAFLTIVAISGAWLAPLPGDAPPPLPREFRGVWVATVANIDWPSKKGLPVPQQKKELLAILDRAAELKLNAVLFQVRPMCDALYASELEPWSEFLTGTLGQAPEPAYDPLELAVQEAHARGLELHAWFNPFRAHQPSATSPIPKNHIIKQRPDLAPKYGKHFWLNPTNADAQEHTLRVFLDVVRRYDIDGIHIDDYFYPYKEKGADGKPIPFPDDDTWAAYQKAGGKLARDDWRRDAINRFVERMFKETKQLKPWVKVGISPFGIWRPGNPPGIAGLDQYAELYADAKHWLNEGWVDYFTPQLYWPIKQTKQSYPRLLEWWVGENKKGRHIWPGNIFRLGATEIVDQIEVTRQTKGASGNVFFSMKTLMNNSKGMVPALKKAYAAPALPPATPWANLPPLAPPKFAWKQADIGSILEIQSAVGSCWIVVQSEQNGEWSLRVLPASDKAIQMSFTDRPAGILVTALDRAGNASAAKGQ